MSQTVDPFRITTEDLPDLDKKTLEGLAPLLDALNATIPQLVALSQQTPVTKSVSSKFTSEAGGSAYVDFAPAPLATVRAVDVDQLYRTDGTDMSTAYSYSWKLTGAGFVRVLFVGLDVSSQYFLAATLR